MNQNKNHHLVSQLVELGRALDHVPLDPTSQHKILNDWFRRESFRSLLSEYCWETDLTEK